MNEYRTGNRSFFAWSEMNCRDMEDHAPHAWDSEFVIYGPYMCWGLPFQGPKHRKDGGGW